MTEVREYSIPADRLAGFLQRLESAPDPPSRPVAAATLVVLRPGPNGRGLEVLLLRRHESAAFVPGVYVFPGGVVDPDDSAGRLLARADGVTSEEAAQRLGLPDGNPPALAYYLAALRETFEETGILLGRSRQGELASCAANDAATERRRGELLRRQVSFADVVEALDCRLACDALAYIAHWVTPAFERRRYDTRFFAAAVPREWDASPHRLELVDAVWYAPSEALERHDSGALPMILPTVHTLEKLRPFSAPEEALSRLSACRVTRMEPEVVRRGEGIALVVLEE